MKRALFIRPQWPYIFRCGKSVPKRGGRQCRGNGRDSFYALTNFLKTIIITKNTFIEVYIMGKCIRFLCAALMLSMLFSLASCGYGETEKTPIESGTSSQSQTDEGTDHEVSETDEGTKTEESTGTDAAAATVEETVLWDNEDIKITAESLTSDNTFYILHLQIENKTAEDLYIMASRCAVNGFVAEPVMSVDVPANSTTKGEVKFYRKDVYRDVVADIEIRFHYNSKKTERVKLETSAAASFDYSYDDSGTLLYEENGIKIVCQGFTDDGNPIIYLYSTGELSEGCVVEEYEIYINGKKSRADFCNWVFPNTRNVAEMSISDKDIDGNELGDVESIQVSFKISKENMADSHPVKTQLLEIPVK